MEAKVPQRIDMEDKIIGPLTLVQFLYLLFGGLFIYLLNSWTKGTAIRFFYYPVAVIVGLLAMAFAFLKIQDRPFLYFFFSFLNYLRRPRNRVWMKGEHIKLARVVQKAAPPKTEAPRKEFDRQRVKEVTKVIDAIGQNP